METNGYNAEGEKPLSGGAKFMLVLAGGAVLLSFYLFCVLAILLLTGLIGFELLIFLVLARFGVVMLMAPCMGKHMGLAALLVKNFRLKKGVEFRIPLRPEDAPALHEMLDDLCHKLELALPQEVVLQMGDVAWVHLRGIRSGTGKTTLGVGYDLLAGLTMVEMEAVLAHEMTHAKLINRGFRNWLGAGQTRIRTLAMALWTQVNQARRARKTANVAQALFVVVDRLVRLSTRLAAAYSRQNEFEADRGAAELCGAATMKSVLTKLDSLHRITSRLPWNERVAQLQQTAGYSRWLLQEIAHGTALPAGDLNQGLFNKYSTHPLIRDRLAALPPDEKAPVANSPSAIQLLAKPDELAVKLVTELQRLLAGQEEQDSKALEKFSRKTGRQAHLRPWQLFGLVLMLGGFIAGMFGFGVDAGFEVVCMAVIGAGMVAYRLGRYRDQIELPVPSYAQLVRRSPDKAANENIEEKQKIIAAELAKRFERERKSKQAALLAKECYAALETCDYLRAHMAARECLKFDNKSVAGALGLAVAVASYGQIPRTAQLLGFVQRRTGFTTFSTSWGAAWAALLAGDWIHAEAMLEKALKLQPQQTTLISLLAIAQSRRGKVQSAISNARRACEACPDAKELKKYLIARLLDGGYTREAREKMEEVKMDLDSDAELMFSMTQFHLLQGRYEEAGQWPVQIKQKDDSGQMLVRLGKLYETTRLKDHAVTLYGEALAKDHYPEAHLGLGRIQSERGDKVGARQNILAALNLDRAAGKGGVGSWQVLQPVLAQLFWLNDPVPGCQAWIVCLPKDAQPVLLAGKSFTVYALDQPQAQEYFRTAANAFNPGKPPMLLTHLNWRAAPRPLQPDGPVRPGVQGLWH